MYIAHVDGLTLDICILTECKRTYYVKDKEYDTLKKFTERDGVRVVRVEYEEI